MSFGILDWLASQTLWIISIIILLGFCSIYFYYKSYKSDIDAQKQILFGYGLFYTCYGITRIFFFFETLYPSGTFESEIFTALGYFVGYISAIFIFYVLEKYMIKTKFVFTAISITAFSIAFFFTIFLLVVATFAPTMLVVL
ncbi:MAG: hypothetical protein ACXQS8_03370, partial [Candidatus Helarchaeales archaeon]